MIRNVVIAVSTLLILGVLFVGYTLLVGGFDPTTGDRPEIADLPRAGDVNETPFQPVANVPVKISPGEGGGMTVYDERTGRPTHRFEYATWRPVVDSKNEFFITKPRLFIRASGDRVASISADEGRVTVERVDRSEAGWKFGLLKGRVTIHVDQIQDESDLSKGGGPSPDRISITMDDMYFDLELGKIRTAGPILARSADFDLAGEGLDMTWNQAANRIDELTVARGRHLVLRRLAGIAGAAPAEEDSKSTATQSKAHVPPPASAPRIIRRSDVKKQKRPTAYVCSFEGPVNAEQRLGDQLTSSLTADGGLRLLIDTGRGDDLLLGGRRTTSQPTTSSAPSERALALYWSGTLRLGPINVESTEQPGRSRLGHDAPLARRRLEALGPVRLRHQDAVLNCGRLEYHDETQRVWLTRDGNEPIRLTVGEDRTVSAQSIYIDRKSNVIKLVGDVRLESRPAAKKRAASGPATAADDESSATDEAVTTPSGPLASARTYIRCAQIAELTLYEDETTTTQPGNGGVEIALGGLLKSAVFRGDVDARLGNDRLSGESLALSFRRPVGKEPFDRLITAADATGGVRLVRDGDSVACGRLILGFTNAADGESYPSRFDAVGSVMIHRGESRLSGDRVLATLRRPEPTTEESRSDVRRERIALEALEVLERAELVDPQRKIAARGKRIAAWSGPDGRIARGEIEGTRDRFALAHSGDFTVRGRMIELSADGRTLHVDGPSRLTLRTTRSLQGRPTARPQSILVRGEQLLHIDGDQNRVRIEGDVSATSGSDSLRGTALTLVLHDAARPAGEADSKRDALAFFRQLVAAGRGRDADEDFASLSGVDRFQKEPVVLIVEDATAASEQFEAGSAEAVVHSSLEAPRLEVDLIQRQMQTTGRTTLLLTDYRVQQAGASSDGRSTSLAPSDLMSGGPSQSLIVCERSMTYALGEEGPDRRDSVLMEDGVFLVHRVGKDIVNVEQTPLATMLTPEAFKQLRERHTTMRCRRLEAQFGRESTAVSGASASGVLAGLPGARLLWMLGSGEVELTDRQGATNSEVFADRVSFDRRNGTVTILGTADMDARVYRWDTSTGKFSTPATGKEFQIDLINNTLRAGRTSGEFQP